MVAIKQLKNDQDSRLQPLKKSTTVTIKNLVKNFGRTEVIKNIDLDIQAGEFMTLLGPSGCGKSTILNMILGVFEPTLGEIRFDGRVINKIPMNKRDVGMVFQNYALFPHMTVEKNVSFGLEMRKISKEERQKRVDEALEMVQLRKLAKRFPRELSGGQQQRVALARALVIQPKVLLLDEPLSNLDAKLRKDMRLQLKRLHEELKITTIFVTHDQEEALSLSTKVAILSDGVLQQVGTPKEIFQNPANLFVADFIGYGNFLEGKLTDEKGDCFIFETKHGNRLFVKKKLGFQIGQEAVLTIKSENVRIVEGNHYFESNVLPGTISSSDYTGGSTTYEVKIENGDMMKLSTLGLDPYALETKVNLYLDPDHLLLLNKE